MGDLISRSGVMKILTDLELQNGTFTDAKIKLRDLPTAYDVDKVVAELEDAKDCIEEYPYTGARCPNEIEIIELEKAIDIVKRGDRDE